MYGQYDTLRQELMQECQGDFKSYMLMEPDMFCKLCDCVGPRVAKRTS